jgi:hypothetical protein
VKLLIPNFDPDERAGQIRVLAFVIALFMVPPAGLWAVGNDRHDRDKEWCSTGRADRDAACIARREARRWGPFLAFGPSANRSSERRLRADVIAADPRAAMRHRPPEAYLATRPDMTQGAALQHCVRRAVPPPRAS